jgi:Zn-dependent protease
VSSRPRSSRDNAVLALLAGVILILVVRRHVIRSDTLLLLAVLIPSIILHEVSHGALALLFGDDTAKRAGRLTLNPIPHVDPFGTLILPAILVLSGAPPFGWAKPVPVNVRRLRDPRNQSLLVSLVGPAVNATLAVLAGLALRYSRHLSLSFGGNSLPQLHLTTVDRALFLFGAVNVVLAAFNLIPLPPLDGSAVLERLLPASLWPGYLRLRQYSMLILFAVVFLVPGFLGRVFGPALHLWSRLLT